MSTGSGGTGPAISRDTIDLGHLRHYIWRSPFGQDFDLLLDAEVLNGRLILREAHIMPQTGTYSGSRLSLGLPGLRQLQRDLAAEFGATVIEIPNRIGRATGRTGGFGPGVYPIR